MPDMPKRGFNVFAVNDGAKFNRVGKKIMMKCLDGSNNESDSVEANLLFEIMNALKAKR